MKQTAEQRRLRWLAAHPGGMGVVQVDIVCKPFPHWGRCSWPVYIDLATGEVYARTPEGVVPALLDTRDERHARDRAWARRGL